MMTLLEKSERNVSQIIKLQESQFGHNHNNVLWRDIIGIWIVKDRTWSKLTR